ncbi:MAG: DUF5723 family protein [bacterium]
MCSRRSIFFYVIISFIAWNLSTAGNLSAQAGISNARSMAMGGAYSALARGVESPVWNPANLALSTKRTYRFNLISVGMNFHNNSFNKKQYDLYNGSFLSQQDKQDILSSIPAEGVKVDFDTEVQALGFAVRNFAFTASALAASDIAFSKDIVELALNGNEFGRLYEVGDTYGEGWGVSSFALSGGYPFKVPYFSEFTVGASVKYLRGHAYGKVIEARSSVLTNIDGIHSSGRIVIDHSLGGNGLALDIGSAATLGNQWSFSFGLTNLFSRISWSTDNERFTYTFEGDSVTVQKIEESEIDSVVVNSDETVSIGSFTSGLPVQIKMGVARFMGKMTFSLDYRQGFSQAPGVSTTPEIALGSEIRYFNFFPVRAGLSLGGKRGFSAAAGFAFDFSFCSLDFAISSKGGMFSPRGVGFAFDWMFRF